MIAPIAKVSLTLLGDFLAQHADEWEVECSPSFDEELPPHRPVSTDELMLALSSANQGEGHVYLFGQEMTPWEAATQTDLSTIPDIGQSGITDYVIQMGRAKDFLYIAPDLMDVSNGNYVNIMPVDREEEEGLEDELLDESPAVGFSLTQIALHNFKGIPESGVRIDLKPLTLLFGPNSSGKSTILHALLYAIEILERRNLSPSTIRSTGSHIDFGGFDSLIHNRQVGDVIGLGFEFDLGDSLIPSFALGEPIQIPDSEIEWGATAVEWPDINAEVRSGRIDLSVGWSDRRQTCYVASYHVHVNGQQIVSLRADVDRRAVDLHHINFDHPLFARVLFPNLEVTEAAGDSLRARVAELNGTIDLDTEPIAVVEQSDALPIWGRGLDLEYREVDSQSSEQPLKPADLVLRAYSQRLTALLSQIVVGMGEVLRSGLGSLCHLGPLREPPERNFQPTKPFDSARWSNGLAAWDLLYDADEDLIRRVSSWLSDPSRLRSGYSLAVRAIAEVDFATLSALVQSERIFEEGPGVFSSIPGFKIKKRFVLSDDSYRSPDGSPRELQPNDVGIGISQIIPVLVAALDDRVTFAAVEQPELHVHPRMQVGLGDLFISKVHQTPQSRMIVETHSEHLLLRVLKRIRDTHDGILTAGKYPSISPKDVAVYFVESAEGKTTIRTMQVLDNGEFTQRWPGGFFEEREKELF